MNLSSENEPRLIESITPRERTSTKKDGSHPKSLTIRSYMSYIRDSPQTKRIWIYSFSLLGVYVKFCVESDP